MTAPTDYPCKPGRRKGAPHAILIDDVQEAVSQLPPDFGRLRQRRAALPPLLIAVLCVGGVQAGSGHKRYVAVPDVEWVEILPYLRAHIVAYLHEDQFDVYVCADRVDRSVVQPYDEPLSDFVKVLLHESIQSDRAVRKALEVTTDGFRARLPELTPDERKRYRDVYWGTLRRSSSFFDGLRSGFEQAVRQGRVRCRGCEQDPAFAPSTTPYTEP